MASVNARMPVEEVFNLGGVLEQIGVTNKIIMDSGTDIWGQKKGNACNGILVSGGIRS